MTDMPTRREFEVLKALCFEGSVEDRSQWAGVGDGTEQDLLSKGWIEPTLCQTYGTVGFRATDAGHEAHQRGWAAGFQ